VRGFEVVASTRRARQIALDRADSQVDAGIVLLARMLYDEFTRKGDGSQAPDVTLFGIFNRLGECTPHGKAILIAGMALCLDCCSSAS